jgi:hypothetical protein
MGFEAKLIVVPQPASFRPEPAALAALVAALRRGRWVADPAEPWFPRMTFDTDRAYAHAASTGAYVRRLGEASDPGVCAPLRLDGLEPFLASISREERRIVWPVCRLGETPLRYPLNADPPHGREEAYYTLELWLADDYVYVTSESVDPFDDERCAACGASLVADVEEAPRSLFHARRLRRRCPRCGEPFEASTRDAAMRDPFTGGDERVVAGGAAFRLALVVDCGKCFPDTDAAFGPHPELLALCETELGVPFRSFVEGY